MMTLKPVSEPPSSRCSGSAAVVVFYNLVLHPQQICPRADLLTRQRVARLSVGRAWPSVCLCIASVHSTCVAFCSWTTSSSRRSFQRRRPGEHAVVVREAVFAWEGEDKDGGDAAPTLHGIDLQVLNLCCKMRCGGPLY